MTRISGPEGKLYEMSEQRSVRVLLELEPGSDPPRGRIVTNDRIHAFTGWIGLAAALEAINPSPPPRQVQSETPPHA